MRHDFPPGVKSILAARVAYRCSNPDCGAVTSGPQLGSGGAVNVGVAAHITAAAEGGPRYDTTLTPQQRSSTNNGIWLCQTDAKLIDSDVVFYTEALLRQWKADAEKRTHQMVSTGLRSSDTLADLVVEITKVQSGAHWDTAAGSAQSFAINFESYLANYLGDVSEWSMWTNPGALIIRDYQVDHLVAGLTDKHEMGLLSNHTVDVLTFLLVLAWHRGYLMSKFFIFDRVPPPGGPVDPVKIIDRIISMAGAVSDGDFIMGSQIELTLQLLVSWASEAEKVQDTFKQFRIEPVTDSFVDDWAAAVRSAHGSGILTARSEVDLTRGAT